MQTADLLWPAAGGPDDLPAIEQIPLSARDLPASTYELVARAAELWPDRAAVSVMPDAQRWETPVTRTFAHRDVPLYGTFWKIVERYRVAAMSAVPTVYQVLAQVPVDADISSLKLPVVGAAPLPAAVRETFAAHTGVELCEGYGLTEGTCTSSRSWPDAQRPGTVGQRMPYQEARTVAIDEATGEWTFLPAGQAGTLVLRGPNVFAGYLGPDGELDGAVTAAAAVGRPDPHSGEVPVVFVAVAAGSAVTPDELREWANEHVPERAAAPKSVDIVDAIPLTAVGKPHKPELRRHAAERAARDALAETTARDEVHAVLVDGAVEIHVAHSADDDAVCDALSAYAWKWRLT